MKKLFFAIYFIFSACITLSSHAAVTTMEEAYINNKTPKNINLIEPVEGMPDPNNYDEVLNFFTERFRNASFTYTRDMGDMSKSGTIDIQHSKEYIEDLQQEKKSTFEKIYDEAMKRISGKVTQGESSSQTVFYTQKQDNNQISDNKTISDIDVINVMLPTGTKVVVPAMEHIPYILTSINILPTGLIQIDEEITVVANNQKVKNGIVKILPKYSKSRTKVKKKLDIELLNVSVNGENIAYILEEIGDKIYIKPQVEYVLAPGVYNYKFSYLLDRKLWYYDDFTEFYWDISGSYLNLVITSANAIVSIPDGKSYISQNVLTGYSNNLSSNRAVIAKLDSNALGFASLTPLLPGEGMHILVSLDKNTFLHPDINRMFVWFITDYGNIFFAFLGLLVIVISYILSWNYIKRNKSKIKVSFKNTAPSLRYFINNIFDKKSFVAFLLELKRRQYIDIQKQDNNILLIKKTDNLSFLSKSEKKALNDLFSGKDSVISVSSANMLKFKRAYKEIKKYVLLSIKRLNLKLNLSYLAFSVGMLIMIEIAISMLGINKLQTVIVLLSSSMTIAFYTYMLKRSFASKVLGYIIKTFGVVFICFAILFMSIYIHLISSILIAISIYIIFEYSIMFSKRTGLLKNKIKEAERLKDYLKNNVQKISTSQEFLTQQANIYALELDNLYSKTDYNNKVYVLDIARDIEILL